MAMLSGFSRRARALCRNKSGNAMLMVALATPALIGGGGLAVDTAQWYMWKRELQHSVDPRPCLAFLVITYLILPYIFQSQVT